MKRVPDVTRLKSCFNLRFVTFSYALFSKIISTATSIVSCKGILVKRLQISYETKSYHYCLLLYFFAKTKRIFSTILFWDNWIKKLRDKFSKIVIISAYERHNWLKKNNNYCRKKNCWRNWFRILIVNNMVNENEKSYCVIYSLDNML